MSAENAQVVDRTNGGARRAIVDRAQRCCALCDDLGRPPYGALRYGELHRLAFSRFHASTLLPTLMRLRQK